EEFAVDLDPASGGDEIEVAARRAFIGHAVPGLHRSAQQAGVGPDAKRFGVILITAGQNRQPAGTVAPGERLRPPAWGTAPRPRNDPDLEERGRFVLQIIFGVADAGARAHHLDVARFRAALVAKAVLMGDRAL